MNNPTRTIGFLCLLACLSSCNNRDKEAPSVFITHPAFDGENAAFGEVIFVGFVCLDDREDGGIWRAEIRSENGVNVLASQAGIWAGQGTDTLVVPFLLNAPTWSTSTMTLAVLADDAAGNRSAAFRTFDYTGSDDLPETALALTLEDDGSSTLFLRDNPSEAPSSWTGLPASHTLAVSSQVLALGHATDASVLLLDIENGDELGEWTDLTSSGTEPLIRRVHDLEPQAGFLVVHAGGLVAITTSGQLLFERFSEAPWSPIDAVFDGNQCVLWERNEATQSERLRSWNYQTGAAGPIIPLASSVHGIGAVASHSSLASGGVFLISEEQGLTLCDAPTGILDDLCPLLGSGELGGGAAIGVSSGDALFVRDSNICRQSVSDVTNGSVWPFDGTVKGFRKGADFQAWLSLNITNTSSQIWGWPEAGGAPELLWDDLPANTVDMAFVTN